MAVGINVHVDTDFISEQWGRAQRNVTGDKTENCLPPNLVKQLDADQAQPMKLLRKWNIALETMQKVINISTPLWNILTSVKPR